MPLKCRPTNDALIHLQSIVSTQVGEWNSDWQFFFLLVQHTSHGLTHWSSYSILQNKQPRLKRSITLQMLRHEVPPKSCSPYASSSDKSTHNLISKRMTIATPVGEAGNSELDQAISFLRLHTLKIINSVNPNMIFNLALNTNPSFWFQIFDAAYSLMNQTKANFEQQKKSNHWSQR